MCLRHRFVGRPYGKKILESDFVLVSLFKYWLLEALVCPRLIVAPSGPARRHCFVCVVAVRTYVRSFDNIKNYLLKNTFYFITFFFHLQVGVVSFRFVSFFFVFIALGTRYSPDDNIFYEL